MVFEGALEEKVFVARRSVENQHSRQKKEHRQRLGGMKEGGGLLGKESKAFRRSRAGEEDGEKQEGSCVPSQSHHFVLGTGRW